MAFNNAFTIIRNSGTNETSLRTLNILSNLPSKTNSLSSKGIRLPVTIIKSKMFHPFLKKSKNRFSTIILSMSSTTKNNVISVSKSSKGAYIHCGRLYVLAPTASADSKITIITMVSKGLQLRMLLSGVWIMRLLKPILKRVKLKPAKPHSSS